MLLKRPSKLQPQKLLSLSFFTTAEERLALSSCLRVLSSYAILKTCHGSDGLHKYNLNVNVKRTNIPWKPGRRPLCVRYLMLSSVCLCKAGTTLVDVIIFYVALKTAIVSWSLHCLAELKYDAMLFIISSNTSAAISAPVWFVPSSVLHSNASAKGDLLHTKVETHILQSWVTLGVR